MKVRLKGLCSGGVNMYVGVGFHSDSSCTSPILVFQMARFPSVLLPETFVVGQVSKIPSLSDQCLELYLGGPETNLGLVLGPRNFVGLIC